MNYISLNVLYETNHFSLLINMYILKIQVCNCLWKLKGGDCLLKEKHGWCDSKYESDLFIAHSIFYQGLQFPSKCTGRHISHNVFYQSSYCHT